MFIEMSDYDRNFVAFSTSAPLLPVSITCTCVKHEIYHVSIIYRAQASVGAFCTRPTASLFQLLAGVSIFAGGS